jgi:intracellular sulfur oxidation DsrE/DsrF family protein
MSTSQGIVIHVTSGESGDFETALRNLVNLVQEESVSTPPEKMQVVVNGRAVRFLLATAPEAAKLTRMADSGVRIGACANSLDRFGYAPEDLADGVATIPSGVAEVARAQQHGATYLKLP